MSGLAQIMRNIGFTIQGSDLRSVCDNLGLLQLTREPTRQQYLLDLVLSDVFFWSLLY